MIFADSHTHIYLSKFNSKGDSAIERALDAGVKYMVLPNIDLKSIRAVFELSRRYKDNCFATMGLHPTSVKEDWKEVLGVMEKELTQNREIIYAVGEVGIDLHWDTTFIKQQQEALEMQANWAIENNLPIIIHSRKSHREIMDVLGKYKGKLRGVFHCFSEGYQEAVEVLDLGFYLGISGVVTYKSSNLAEVVKKTGLEKVVLETDAPWLPPVPYRGKKNESSYIPIIAEYISKYINVPLEEVAEHTTNNTLTLFNIK